MAREIEQPKVGIFKLLVNVFLLNGMYFTNFSLEKKAMFFRCAESNFVYWKALLSLHPVNPRTMKTAASVRLPRHLDVGELLLELRRPVHGERLEGVQDGAVAGAATQVPVQGLLHLLRRQAAAALQLSVGEGAVSMGCSRDGVCDRF